MNKYTRIVAEDFATIQGRVVASYSDLIRVQSEHSEPLGFKAGSYVKELPVGTPVTVIALRGSDKAFYVINHDTNAVRKIDLWSGNVSNGFQQLQFGMGFITFFLLLVPFIGQFAALTGGFGGVIAGVASSGIKGMPPISVGRTLGSMAVYFVGSIWFFLGWFSGDQQERMMGFLILTIGAGLFCFYAPRPRHLYLNAINELVEKCRRTPATL